MAAFVVVNLMCDVCTLIGPRLCRIGESGEVKLPQGWLVEGEECFCSTTCRARKCEVMVVKGSLRQWEASTSFEPGSAPPPYVLQCLGPAEGVECSRYQRVLVMQLLSVLPPGWIDADSEAERRARLPRRGEYTNVRYGVCRHCQEAR